MARRDWHDDETIGRDRSRDDRERTRGAFFGGRDDDDMDRHSRRERHDGWGGLMSDRDSERGYRGHRRDEDERFPDDFNRGVPMDETKRLIASNKVEGTSVFDRSGDGIGTIHNFMVDKHSGQVKYAVLRHSSGFLGLGESYYPLSWDELTYDTDKDGYRIDMLEDELRDRSSFDSSGRWRDRSPRGRGGSRSRDRYRERDRDRDRDSR